MHDSIHEKWFAPCSDKAMDTLDWALGELDAMQRKTAKEHLTDDITILLEQWEEDATGKNCDPNKARVTALAIVDLDLVQNHDMRFCQILTVCHLIYGSTGSVLQLVTDIMDAINEYEERAGDSDVLAGGACTGRPFRSTGADMDNRIKC